MTQEEKAKRYDEVLEELRGLLECVREDKREILEEDITNIFPELQENEDERIRKGIIRNLEYLMDRAEGFVKDELRERIAWLEKQGEQKPIDKVEPKFKNGQWIVWQDKCYKVNYNGYGYELVDQNGLSTSLEYGTIDENAHIWDITKDARDGDVLVYGDNPLSHHTRIIMIFKSIRNTNSVFNHFHIFDNEFRINDWCDCGKTVHPATIEQRRELMKAMADAGYTFDFEKKELKKIENETEIPFGAKDSELQEATYYIPKGFHTEIDEDRVVIKKGEKPTEWSEEDNVMIRCITLDLELLKNRDDGEAGKAAYQSEIEWLKSIKDRYTWKPSDEQMAVLNEVINYAANSEFQHWSNFIYTLLKSLREQLKKL